MRHPVELDDYVLPTNALEAFVNVVLAWIRGNVTGALVPGLQRIGKSYAIQYFAKNYQQWLGNTVGIVSAEVIPHKQTSEGVFFFDLLRTMGRPTTKKSPEDRRSLFVGRLVEAAARSQLKKVVVILDEAHLLDDFLFKLLIAVHNELWRIHGIKCTWILVGQPELEGFVSTYLAQGKRQIVGRFMADTYVFQPLLGTDFKSAVECYDLHLKHPVGGPSFTEHFAPDLWAAGWTLVSDIDVLWKAISSAREDQDLPSSSGMTMQGFTTLMNYILTQQLPTMKVGDRLTSEMVLEAIETTNCMVFEQQEALMAVA